MKKSYITTIATLLLVCCIFAQVNAKVPSAKSKAPVFIDQALSGFPKVGPIGTHSFQLFSHGRPGELFLENKWMAAPQISAFLKSKIGKDVDHINIYGCEFAKGKQGAEAVNYLEQNLKLKVSASTNITGMNGDWVLEVGSTKDVLAFPAYPGDLQCSFGTSTAVGSVSWMSNDNLDGYTTISNNILNAGGGRLYSDGANVKYTSSLGFKAGDTIFITANYQNDGRRGPLVLTSSGNTALNSGSVLNNVFPENAWGKKYYVIPAGTADFSILNITGATNDGVYVAIDAVGQTRPVCYTCNVNIAPALSATTISNICPAHNTFDLSTITASNTPGGTVLSWHTGTPASNANKINNINAVNGTIFYAAFYNTANMCYSGPDGSATTVLLAQEDSDCDGVADATDLDDDNDGILDALESPDCYYKFKEATKISSVSTQVSTYNTTSYGIANIIDGNSETGVQYNIETAVEMEIFKIQLPTSIAISGIQLNVGTYALSDISGTSLNTMILQGSVDGNIWQDLNTARSYTTANALDTIKITSLGAAYTYYRLLGKTGNTYYGKINEITVLPYNFNASAYPKSTACTADIDGDGIPNQLDLDSDGDGCSDAIEGGANFTAANLVNSSMPGGNTGGTYNGTSNTPVTLNLGNTVGNTTTTMGIPAIAGTGQTVNVSQNKSLNGCIDSDGDGLPDVDDLDDDNDGILDAAESPDCYYQFQEVTNITSVSTQIGTETDWGIGNTIDGNTSTAVQYNLETVVNKEVFKIQLPINIALSGIQLNMGAYALSNTSGTYLNTMILQGSVDGNIWQDLNTARSYTTANALDTIKITSPGAAYTYYRLLGKTGLAYYGRISEMKILPYNFSASAFPKAAACTADTDGDGIPNQLDLDSDGDGCSDAIEGGANFTAANLVNSSMPGGNTGGTYNGTNPTPVIQNLGNTVGNTATTMGVPTIAVNGQSVNISQNKIINGCKDSDGDGFPDVDDLDDDNDGILDTVECPPAAPLCGDANTYTTPGINTTGQPLGAQNYNYFPGCGNYFRCEDSVRFNGSANVNGTTQNFTVDVLRNGHATSACGNSNPFILTGTNSISLSWHEMVYKFDRPTSMYFTYNSLGGGVNYPVRIIFYVDGDSTTQIQGIEDAGIICIPKIITSTLRVKMITGDCHWTYLTWGFYKLPPNYGASIACDLDGDGIPNSLDLDSDGDGCSDAIEGGANFTAANLVNSNMPGGNSGIGYTGTSINPVITNLGNTVAANGVPTIANGGQTVNTSQNATQQDAACVQAPIHNPDFGVTYVNVQLDGNVSTNDKPTPGSTYGNPGPNPSNPSSCIPTVLPNGSYTFKCATPGVYVFQVPVCEPAPSTLCKTVPLTITVLDPSDSTSAPVANPDFGITKVNTPVTINIKANDKCQNGTGCTLGTPTIMPGNGPKNGTFDPTTGVYTPVTGFVGKDSLQYSVCDNQTPTPKCATAWVYIDVLPVLVSNRTNATDDYVQTLFNTPVSGTVKTNDADPEGNQQNVTAQTTTIPGKGTLVLNTNGTYTFTPVNGFSGPVEFPYTTCDVVIAPIVQACASATLHILVEPSVPKYDPDFGVTYVNVQLNGNVSTNDGTPGVYSNPPANPSNPSSCTPTIGSTGTYTFICATPGVYVFNVPTCEPAPGTACTTVPLTITVLDPNDATAAPIANTDNGVTKMNTPVTIDIKSNDKCQNGTGCTLGTPTIVAGNGPKNGTFDPGTGIYTPNTGFTGRDSLQYQVCDNQAPSKCATAWVYIDVLPTNAPNSTQAADDYAQTLFNTPTTGNVKTNDTDAEGNPQSVTPQTTTIPGKGTLVLNTNGTYTFTPVNGFSGPVEFPYTTCDNGSPVACASATLHILVEPYAPKYDPDFGVTYVNVQLNGNVSTNDGTPGVYSNPPANPSNPSSCTPTIGSTGTYTFICATPGVYVFNVPTCEPAPGTACTTVPLTITVLDPNDATAAPIANTDNGVTKMNTPVTIDIKSNDKCQNGTGCTLGTPTIVAGNGPKNGTFDPGTGIYTPNTGFTGRDSLQYQVCDNQAPSKCATAWVYIDVLPTSAPNTTQAADDYAQTLFNTPTTGNVKTNDTDAEGNPQSVTAQTTTIPGKGTLVLNTNGTYTFTPVNGFSGPVEFPYTTCDNGSPVACASATLHILVEPFVPVPDLTPTNSIDRLNFVEKAERDFTVNLFEILGVDALSSTQTIQFVVSKLDAFDITVPGITLSSADQPGVSGTSMVGAGRQNQNENWLFRQVGTFIVVTAKPGVNISASGIAVIGFHVKRKGGIPTGTSQNITATIIPGSGGEVNTINNVAITTISTN